MALSLIHTLVGYPSAGGEPASEPPGAIFTCYQRAHDGTLLEAPATDDLCRGAADDSPAACYIGARQRTYLSSDDALSLCRCATSTEPVDCYLDGYQKTTLAPEKILALCSPRAKRHLEADCSPSR